MKIVPPNSAQEARKAQGSSLQPPEDLRRAGETTDPSGGSPNGGNIWPDQ